MNHRSYLLTFLIIVLLRGPSICAQTTPQHQLKLLNPDGSPAVDAKVVVKILGGAHAELDGDLKSASELTREIKNEAGTIACPFQAHAIIAQSDKGFVFVPMFSSPATATLRPWAKLNIDVTNLELELVKDYQIDVVWQNNYAGRSLVVIPKQQDPFGGSEIRGKWGSSNNPLLSREPYSSPEWRLGSIVEVRKTLEVKTQTINVPPGEISVALRDGTSPELARNIISFAPQRSPSSKTVEFVFPVMSIVEGEVKRQTALPEWLPNSETRIAAESADAPLVIPQPDAQSDGLSIEAALTKFYASSEGTKFRVSGYPLIFKRLEDEGEAFRLPLVPSGTFSLKLINGEVVQHLGNHKIESSTQLGVLEEVSGSSDLGSVEINDPLGRGNPGAFGRGDSGAFVVDASLSGSRAVVDPFGTKAEATRHDDLIADHGQPLQQNNGLVNQPFIDDESRPRPLSTAAEAEARIKESLQRTVQDLEFNGTPFNQVPKILSDQADVPIYARPQALAGLGISEDHAVDFSMPPMTLQSALTHLLDKISPNLSFTVRDEVLLITDWEDAERTAGKNSTTVSAAEQDTGKQFIERWVNQDDSGLRDALKKHLKQEFDANQESRQAELKRLESLLQQSQQWLEARKTKRQEIIDKRLDELLESR